MNRGGAGRARFLLASLGLALVLAGAFLPRGWYDGLPRRPDTPPVPIKGVTLLQITLALEGALLLTAVLKGAQFNRVASTERLPTVWPRSGGATRGVEMAALLSVGAVGLLLRAMHLDSDLWLDEISPVLDYAHLSVLQIVGTYLSPNNHLLNTLLVKLAIAVFGEHEWSIRLPAVLFGVATIPAMYWVARLMLPRIASVGASLLLAVSYHHIFFSQNARGYSAYLLFSIASSGLLVKALQEDRLHLWALYIGATVLGFASHLNSGFVFVAHVVVGVAAILRIWRTHTVPWSLIKRLSAVFAAAGFLGFQLYATMLPQAYVVIRSVYSAPEAGFSPFSKEFVNELVRGIGAGFGTGLLLGALPFLALAAFGFARLFRREWALIGALTLPCVLTALWLVVDGLPFSPRFFLLGLPVAILAVVAAIDGTAEWLTRSARMRALTYTPFAAGSILLLAAVSLASLGRYYSVPKQAYRASLEYIEAERRPGDIVVVIDLAEMGFRYYGRQFGLHEGEGLFFVRTPEAFDAVLEAEHNRRSVLVTTFSRALHMRSPELERRITAGWAPARTFPATVGNGEISVWRMR